MEYKFAVGRKKKGTATGGKIKDMRKESTYEFHVHKSQCMCVKFHVRMTQGK
jgi:hypothetical protein